MNSAENNSPPSLYRWDLVQQDYPQDLLSELASKLRCGELVAKLLINRGVSDVEQARKFLDPKLSDMFAPEALSGCVEAAELLASAASSGAKIVIYGDYDVDGITATAILYRALRHIGGSVDYYIPHRVDEGYGLNVEAIEKIAADGAELIVTVDCGITSCDSAARAAELGVELIITDHHAPPDELPVASAIVHPHLGNYPNPALCGAGVSLKLAWQTLRQHEGTNKVSEELKELLLDATCLAAIGTVADVVELTGENRSLVAYGLKAVASSNHAGLQSLIDASGLRSAKLSEYDVGFAIGPRLNAAGRMGSAALAADLLIKPDEIDPAAAAKQLSKTNEQRKELEKEITAEAVEQVNKDDTVCVVCGDGWHPGVVGIVASRLVDKFGKPAIVLCREGDTARGSARSIAGFNLIEAMRQCGDTLISCGGHAMAAGLRIESDKVTAFTEQINKIAAGNITAEMLRASINVDAEIPLEFLTLPMVRQILRLAPFGQGNPKVMLAVKDAVIHAAPRRIGSRGSTLSLLLAAGKASAARARLRCVGFGLGHLVDNLAGVREVSVVGEPVIDNYTGREEVQMLIKDVRWH